MSLLEQDTIRKEQIDDDENNAVERDAGDKIREYKVEAIWDSAVYAIELELGHLPGLYYLVLWKGYLEEENICKRASAVQHLRKFISSFHKNHLDKPIVTFFIIDIAPPMDRPTVKLLAKQKQGRPTGCTKKRAK